MVDHALATPLHDAATYNELGVAKLLIDHGAKLDMTDKEGGTPLHKACMRADNTEMIKLLVDSIPEPNQKTVSILKCYSLCCVVERGAYLVHNHLHAFCPGQ